MSKLVVRLLLSAATITYSSLGFPNQARACMIFGQADPVYWSEHATSIVDATIFGYYQRPLARSGVEHLESEYPDPWVLKLNVHRTLRGDGLERREVATRFLNTTIVDEAFIAGFVGHRREFAIVDVPYVDFPSTFPASYTSSFLVQDGVHVLDSNGEEIDEIWEHICMALPIFEIGTFED
ncbi:hypothetical protein [uncultured Litoreibacter sp.]|uniref:hypothetical protein n=1 Tax=uncultured Litoreibacter sp. TaxID=1392394 RepID=UPI0026258100|nr:hypothetical protein [uncultured Litoreibacter sp.]